MPQRGGNRVEQPRLLYWLFEPCQNIRAAKFRVAQMLAERGEHDDPRGTKVRMTRDRFRERLSVHLGHVHVEQGKLEGIPGGAAALQERERLGAAGRKFRRIPQFVV